MNIDDIEPQHKGGQTRIFNVISAILWGLVISALVALRLNGTSALEVVDLFRISGLTVAIAILVIGVAGILYKTLQYVGMTVTMIKRLFYLIGFLAIISLTSTFVL